MEDEVESESHSGKCTCQSYKDNILLKRKLQESQLKVKQLEALLEENEGQQLKRKRRKLNSAVENVDGETTDMKLVTNDIGKSSEEEGHTLTDTGHHVGYFTFLPTEILHKVMAMLGHKELFYLAMTSHDLCSYVRGYVVTERGLNHVLDFMPSSAWDYESIIQMDTRTMAKNTGKLLRVIAMLEPMCTRLVVASHFLKKLLPGCCIKSEDAGTDLGYSHLATILHIYWSGWSYTEKLEVFSLVQSIGNLEGVVRSVLDSSQGHYPWREKDIHYLYGSLFLPNIINHSACEEYAFWLFHILKPWPPTSQAKLFFILCAITISDDDEHDFVPWEAPSDIYHLETFSIPRPLSAMYSHREQFGWTEDEIISMLNAMIFSDQVWCFKSITNILVECESEEFTKSIVKSWVLNMYFTVKDLASLFYNLGIHISSYLGCCPRTVKRFLVLLSHAKQLLPSPSRETFIDEIFKVWTSNFNDPFVEYRGSITTGREMYAFQSVLGDEFADGVYSAIDLCFFVIKAGLDKLEL